MFDIDTGSNGANGPFLQWSARGTQDGAIPAKSFYVRDGSEKTVLPSIAEGGIVLDLDSLKTGWQKSDGISGVAPEWKWNPTVSQFQASPGEDYKKGLSIRCAIGGGKSATWEQAGAAAWNAFVALVPALQQRPDGKLPLVKLTGTKLQQFKRGSTVEPVLEVVKWVDRPDCLKEGAAAGIATEPVQQQAQPVQQQVQAAAQTAAPADAEF
ncbi:hypothetical protein [Paracoccus sp. 22332]|uniref:hypothetical protein n=1 Tax=Paracoccus sp. 22332 TaxID=3453913 RepID=UPI003F878833